MFILQTILSEKKRLDISLLDCFGLSHTSTLRIYSKLGYNFGFKNKKIKNHLNDFNLIKMEWFIPQMIRRLHIIHTIKLRYSLYNSLKKIKALKTLKGFRHTLFLPVRGQRTKKNAQTQKSKRLNRKKVVVSKKKKKK
jgi:ribosomal protein S13